MVASVQSGRLIDGTDEGLLRGSVVIHQGYVPGELLPPDATVGTPPVVTILSPAAGTSIARTAPLILTATDDEGLTLERLMIRSGGTAAKWEQAYRDGAACAGFTVTRTVITDGYQYEITRDGGWNAGGLELEPVFGDPTATASINT